MSDPLAPVGDGHTALGPDEPDGLIPSYISTRGELDVAEQDNILRATAHRPAPAAGTLLDHIYLRHLHEVMFRDVWTWAGDYRKRDTNIGVPWEQIPTAIASLLKDVETWIACGTYPEDEICVRFHHRLVQIHAFPNGNGRHGRIAADYLASALGRPPFTWGANLDVSRDELRRSYVTALRAADAGDIAPLISFARS